MVRIAEAYSDENGKARGGKLGDQTGKEIRIRDWYNRDGGWSVYIECTDPILAEAASFNAELIANLAQYGYNQDDRWSGYDEIVGAEDIDSASAGDFDCSSLALTAYILAGLDVKPEGYTGNIERILLDTGKFVSYEDNKHLSSPDYAKRGSLYLEPKKHVLMVLDDGSRSAKEAEQDTDTPTDISKEIPTLNGDLVVSKGSVRVRTEPIDGDTMMILREGESLPRKSTWHEVDVDGVSGWISANPKYTETK